MSEALLRVITGPTGSGKSRLAESLAGRWKNKIINADPFQRYREIPIISNQSPNSKLEAQFVGDLSLPERTSAGSYAREAAAHFMEPAIWVGTGLYIGATLYGLESERVQGTPFQNPAKVKYRMLVLEPDRKLLYERINQRVDEMLERGALLEAESIFKKLQSNGVDRDHPLLKAIGLKHLLEHLSGHRSLSDSIMLWKRDTRRLAKRQWTWLRKFCPPSESIRWLPESDLHRELQGLEEFLEISLRAPNETPINKR